MLSTAFSRGYVLVPLRGCPELPLLLLFFRLLLRLLFLFFSLFGAFGLLHFELASDEFDDSQIRAVAFAVAQFDDAAVAAVAGGKAGGDGSEKFPHDRLSEKV